MTKEIDIRDGLLGKVKSMRHWGNKPDNPFSAEDDVSDILSYLHSQGVVIKVDRELPKEISKYFPKMGKHFQREMLRAGYVETVPLLELPTPGGVSGNPPLISEEGGTKDVIGKFSTIKKV